MKKFVVVGLILLAALLIVAWIKGGAQPMQWIEQPLASAPSPAPAQALALAPGATAGTQ